VTNLFNFIKAEATINAMYSRSLCDTNCIPRKCTGEYR